MGLTFYKFISQSHNGFYFHLQAFIILTLTFCSLLLFGHGVGSRKKNSNVAKKGPDQQRILNSHTIKSLSTPHLRHVTDFTLGMFRQFSIY